MEQKSVFLGTTVILLIALAATFGVYYFTVSVGWPAPPVTQSSTTTEQKNTLTVSGTGVASVSPDRVKIQMSVVTEGETAELASTNNSERFNVLLTKLIEAGIPKNQIETTQYSIQPIYDYSEKRPPMLIGYRTVHSVTVTAISSESDGLGKIGGKIIDLVVAAGVNQIDNIQFTTSDEKIKTLRSDALKEAVLDAKKKADVLTATLGVTIVNIHQVTESSYIPQPRFYAGVEAGAAKAATELVPGELKVTATVMIVYEISR